MSKTKSLVILWTLSILAVIGTITLFVKDPERWRPPFLSAARSLPVDKSSISRENPFSIPTGPNSSTIVDSSQVSATDYLVKGDFDHVVATAKKELAGWPILMAGDGRLGTQSASTMDPVFATKLRAVKIYRKPEGRMTRVRVWQRYPSQFERGGFR